MVLYLLNNTTDYKVDKSIINGNTKLPFLRKAHTEASPSTSIPLYMRVQIQSVYCLPTSRLKIISEHNLINDAYRGLVSASQILLRNSSIGLIDKPSLSDKYSHSSDSSRI